MDISLYKATPLEKWIEKKYRTNQVLSSSDMDIEKIASIFGGDVSSTPGTSHARWMEDDNTYFVIFLHQQLSEYERRAQFFHELCHPLQHVGNQRKSPMLFTEMQEIQAKHFQLYAAIPLFMLKDMDDLSVCNISNEFRLPDIIVQERLEQIYRRISQAKVDNQLKASLESSTKKSDPSQWSDETKKIMDKLYRQLKMKGAAINS